VGLLTPGGGDGGGGDGAGERGAGAAGPAAGAGAGGRGGAAAGLGRADGLHHAFAALCFDGRIGRAGGVAQAVSAADGGGLQPGAEREPAAQGRGLSGAVSGGGGGGALAGAAAVAVVAGERDAGAGLAGDVRGRGAGGAAADGL